jgi:hypothetical protein
MTAKLSNLKKKDEKHLDLKKSKKRSSQYPDHMRLSGVISSQESVYANSVRQQYTPAESTKHTKRYDDNSFDNKGILSQDQVYVLLINDIKTRHLNHMSLFAEIPYSDALRLNDIVFDEYQVQMNAFMDKQDKDVSGDRVPRDVVSPDLSKESHLSLAEYASLIHPESTEYAKRLFDFKSKMDYSRIEDIVTKRYSGPGNIDYLNKRQKTSFFDYNSSLFVFDYEKFAQRLISAFDDSVEISRDMNSVIKDYSSIAQSTLRATGR